MATPAEAYAAARKRNPRVSAFADQYPFGLDDFQLAACQALASGHGVLVAAPTGAGKTVVGEFAIHLALEAGGKCFYTTPIKALSNQKYAELVERYGPERIGLLTGDNSINGEAPIVVMTTEVLRNMLYADSSTLQGLSYVVMDEVHYLADRFRGAVWEEVIIHLPERVTVVALSATVSNAEEFGAWLQAVRGDTEVIVEEHRPVPLWQHMIAGQRMHDLFVDADQTVVNPELVRMMRRVDPRRPGRRRDPLTPWRTDVIENLESEGLLPAIYFLFSRAGCDDAVEQCMRAGLRLTTAAERREIRAQVLGATLAIPDQDLAALRFEEWREALERGIAAHHAGMLPIFKEVVEDLFQQGLIKIVFATETLALGINMPARSVILEKLVKWNGESHVELTPGEYTQLTGRAGRRGIDVEGHAVVLWHAGVDPRVVAGLASTRTYPLRSSFQPSYNMAVNLVSTLGRHTAREVLETSFAQFQADRSVVGLARNIRKLEEGLAGYQEALACHLGDFQEYAELREELSRSEKAAVRRRNADRRTAAEASLLQLKRGDVFWLTSGKNAGPVVLLDHGGESHRPLVLTTARQARRIAPNDLHGNLASIGKLKIPKNFSPRNAQARKELAQRLIELTREQAGPDSSRAVANAPIDERLRELRQRIRQHPCHGCADREQHARWAERSLRTRREIADITARIESRTNSIAVRFDRICEVLAHLGYLTSAGDDAAVTPSGEQLRWLFGESDLLTSECLRDGVWSDVQPAELAAIVSALVYESRSLDDDANPRLPRGVIADTMQRMVDRWEVIHTVEKEHGLNLTRQPDAGFVWATYRWAQGSTLSEVLQRNDLTAGDFVRWIRQVIDILGQISQAASGSVRLNAEQAIALLRRGVVSGLESTS
jgi:ATP-dependent RNA helicase HelY